MPDVKDDLVTFLRNNVNAGAVSVPFTTTDDIVHADYDGQMSYPQVAVVSRDPIVNGGGATGVTGIDPGGGGPIQDVVYLVQVDCWGGPEDDDVYQNNPSEHPDAVAVELAEEVAETCRVGDENAPGNYNWLMADPPEEADDVEQSPTEHREIVQVRMKWTYGP